MTTLDSKIAIQEEKVDVLRDIMDHIGKRGFAIKNMIDWRRLTLGG